VGVPHLHVTALPQAVDEHNGSVVVVTAGVVVVVVVVAGAQAVLQEPDVP
jgi:hypothetical protein